jgi:biopolymer transport protein ExbB/TolQ
MSFNLMKIISHMGPLGMVIAGFLIMLAIACVGVVVERLIALGRSRRESRLFAQRVPSLIDNWKLDELCVLAESYKASPLARLFAAVLRRYERGMVEADAESAVELAQGEAERSKEALGAELRRGLNMLATTGSIAPFIGLLGTVVGIIAAFQGIASSGSGGIGAISAGIAEALVETALGLLVAIPAVLLFNFLTARINAVDLALARSAGELIDELEVHHGVKRERKKLAASA